jgi:hypothetical protein
MVCQIKGSPLTASQSLGSGIMIDSQFEKLYKLHKWEEPWLYPAGDQYSLKRSSRPIPPRHGVYLIRSPEAMQRVRGSSDLIYIGQSGGGARGGRQGIGPGNGGPGRLFNTRGTDKTIREMIERLFPGKTFRVECAFLDAEDPQEVEAKLLGAYLEDHCELPPANHGSPDVPEALT